MYLVQILLPVRDNQGRPFSKDTFDEVRDELASHFGGVTAFLRSPASGLWEKAGELLHDDVVIYEVMVNHLEREFWRLYRMELQSTFQQEVITMRAQQIDIL